MYRKISSDLKMAAIRMHRMHFSEAMILDICRFSRATLYRSRSCLSRAGTVNPIISHVRGRPRLLKGTDVAFLRGVYEQNPSTYLDEYRDRLFNQRGRYVHISTIGRTLERMRLTRKR
ncbi:hypothetical protein BKA62DRAFT_593475, partial [Auriculariales sp. MPI-PUGE-AT-0066]